MPGLCSYAFNTYYAQNYASIIRKTLHDRLDVVVLFFFGGGGGIKSLKIRN